MPPSSDYTAFKKVLQESKNIVAVAGAGLSAASGLPTFRGTGGLWRKYDAISLASEDAFYENPSRVWQFYHYRREVATHASPNAAHYALARFTSPQTRDTICQPNSTFTLITQNVDGLSPIALKENFSPSSYSSTTPPPISIPEEEENKNQPYIVEMHGRLHDIKCTQPQCSYIDKNNRSSPICKSLQGTEKLIEANVTEFDIPLNELPKCKKCEALARPGVVWFGENIQNGDLIDQVVEKADLCLVIGTSAVVYPAASYATYIQTKNSGKVAVFNIEETDKKADFLFVGPCEETLPRALGI